MSDTITYEQPLNEHIRVCLRLERLFKQIEQHIEGHEAWQSRMALESMLEVLHVTNRPDLKSKFVKALTDQIRMLANGQRPQGMDSQQCDAIRKQLDQHMHALHHEKQKLCQTLYEHAFLRSIHQHVAAPGGACHFNTPYYQLWLAQPHEQRLQDLLYWRASLRQLESMTQALLKLTRESGVVQAHTAEQGFYQCMLDPKVTGQLVQVTIPLAWHVYPEISFGRHRLSVHFHVPEFRDQGLFEKSDKNLRFYLSYCAF